MEVKAQDIIDSVDLSKSEALYPIYESVVNSIISLLRANAKECQGDRMPRDRMPRGQVCGIRNQNSCKSSYS